MTHQSISGRGTATPSPQADIHVYHGHILITVSVLGLILLLLILLYVFKHKQTKKGVVAETRREMNPVYGDYYHDPDPTMEVKDTNAYYSSEYESGTSRTTDNNTYYEM